LKVPSTITALLLGIFITLASVWVGQNNGLMPLDASVEAAKIDTLFNTMLAISTGLFLLVQGALVYSVFRFRKKAGDETDAEPIEGNVPLEILWTAVPTVIVMWLAIYSFDVYKAVDGGNAIGSDHMAHGHHTVQVAMMPGSAMAAPLPSGANDSTTPVVDQTPVQTSSGEDSLLTVNVNGLQYAWIFTYPETGIVSGELHLPQNRPVRLNISAADVIHAFWVPEFRLKQDAVPGQETHLSFIPNKVGNYPLICAELCGAYHGGMRTRVLVQTPEEYQTWVQSQQTTASLDPQTIVAAMHDEAMKSQVAAMGFVPEGNVMNHLHHHSMDSLGETVQVAQSM
jgi:cytochrome c oxidase subunit II